MKLNKLGLGIVAVAIAATTLSAPAKAETNKELATLLAILAGGFVLHEIIDDKNDKKKPVVKKVDTSVTHRHRDGRWHTHASQEELEWYHRHDRVKPPIQRQLMPMPEKCERIVRLKHGKKTKAYSERCLKKLGYKVRKKGKVTHRKWPNVSRKPNLL